MTVIGRDAEYGERLRTYITTSEPPELNDADGLTDSTIDFVQSSNSKGVETVYPPYITPRVEP
jgi:hypothetical protein